MSRSGPACGPLWYDPGAYGSGREGRPVHRAIAIGLALTLALTVAGPVVAGGSKAREVERMAAELERLLGPLVGAIEARDLVFSDQGNGFLSLSYPLERAGRSGRGRKAANDTPFRTLACGHMAAEPTNPATLVTAVISDLETHYSFWWALVNKTDVDETRETTVQVSGPGDFELEASEEVVYFANAVHLVWFNPETPFTETGLYTHRVAVKGGGRVYYRFWAEPASTTDLEP